MSGSKQAGRRLRSLAEPGRAEKQAWFFKTEPGGYGEGDRFLGVRVPDIRRVAREFGDLPMQELSKLLSSPYHEERLLALLVMSARFARGDAGERAAIFEAYVDHMDRVDNWDLVDSSAPQIVGGYLLERDRGQLRELARSEVLWERRIAIIATFAFIREDDFDDTLAIARLLLEDDEDLIHKAVGWMLREVGKRDMATLEAFLDRHCGSMPRTMLRYAVERVRPDRRAEYMGAPRQKRGGRRPRRRTERP